MTLELKTFKCNTLAVLTRYPEDARLTDDPQGAFMAVAARPHGRVPIYRRVPGLETVPYICLRICVCPPSRVCPPSASAHRLRLPTGGGMTIVAAHALRTAARSYVDEQASANAARSSCHCRGYSSPRLQTYVFDGSAFMTTSPDRIPPSRESIGAELLDDAALARDTMALLSRYVQFDTTNPPGAELAAAQWLRDQIIARGITTDITVFEPAAGRGLVVARIPGSEPLKPLVINHHIDVVAAIRGVDASALQRRSRTATSGDAGRWTQRIWGSSFC